MKALYYNRHWDKEDESCFEDRKNHRHRKEAIWQERLEECAHRTRNNGFTHSNINNNRQAMLA